MPELLRAKESGKSFSTTSTGYDQRTATMHCIASRTGRTSMVGEHRCAGSNQTVRNFEYAIGVGDLVVAALMHEERDNDLLPTDTALVAELEQRLCEYKDIEARHGCGSLLKLQISTVAHLARLGRISQDRIDAATRHAANIAT